MAAILLLIFVLPDIKKGASRSLGHTLLLYKERQNQRQRTWSSADRCTNNVLALYLQTWYAIMGELGVYLASFISLPCVAHLTLHENDAKSGQVVAAVLLDKFFQVHWPIFTRWADKAEG